jgi:transposase InsO family protein
MRIWRLLNRPGVAVARCTAERLMRELDITGAVRGKRVITMVPDTSAERAPDLVDGDCVAAAPNRCRAADSTHVTTFAGVVYLAFVMDTFPVALRAGRQPPCGSAGQRAGTGWTTSRRWRNTTRRTTRA